MAEEKSRRNRHTVLLEDRELVAVTGVCEVLSFDEESVVCDTDLGILVISGAGLSVGKLSLESGELRVSGQVEGLTYQDSVGGKEKRSLFGKLFR